MPGPDSWNALCKEVDYFARMQGGKEVKKGEYQEGVSITQ
jgi:hypothetical protein